MLSNISPGSIIVIIIIMDTSNLGRLIKLSLFYNIKIFIIESLNTDTKYNIYMYMYINNNSWRNLITVKITLISN